MITASLNVLSVPLEPTVMVVTTWGHVPHVQMEKQHPKLEVTIVPYVIQVGNLEI